MFAKRAAIAALERVATTEGDLAAGRRFLAGVDPLVRGRALRLMRAAEAEALTTTRVRGAIAAVHAARLAYLALSGRGLAAELVDDVEEVRRAFDEARAAAPRARRWIWPSTALTLLAIGAAGLGAVRLAGRASAAAAPAPRSTVEARPGPPPTGAYARGGAPKAEPTVRRAFAVDLPDFLIALDRVTNAAPGEVVARRAEVDAVAARLAGADVRAALGVEAADRLDELVAAARHAAASGAGRHDLEGDALLRATGALDDALAARDLAYFLDGDVVVENDTGRRHVIVFTFEVRNVGVFESNERVVSLELRRLDRLNWSHALLGFTRPELRAALVLMDTIDRQLVSVILLGLAPEGRVALFDPEDAVVPAELKEKVEMRAGAVVREEYGDGRDAAATAELGATLARRHLLFAGWQKNLEARGVTLSLPGALHVEGDYRAELRPLILGRELVALDAIEAKLRNPGVEAAYLAARARLVTSIERHEVQHRLDFARAEPLRMPPSLERWAGPLEADGRERRAAARARSEMSAYLAEIARDEGTVKADATLTLRFLLDRRLQGIPECYAALAVLEGLAEELGVPIDAPLVEGAEVVRARTATLYLALMDKPRSAIKAAAKRVWEKSFAAPLPPLRRLPAP